MLGLFYYSMRATLMEFFFENDQEQREKITSVSGDQAQIMVDLANKQLAKEKQETEIRQDELKNQSLFKELSGTEATLKTPADELHDNEQTSIAGDDSPTDTESQEQVKKKNLVKNGFVVVDCKTGGVIACPHSEVQSGTSPLSYPKESSQFLVGRCLDITIDVKTFCPEEK